MPQHQSSESLVPIRANAYGDRSFACLHHMEVSALTTPEQFIVGASRCWDAFAAQPDSSLAWRELAPVFAYMNVLGALCPFDSAFRVLQRHHSRLVFRAPDSAPVGLAEARFLCALAALQRGSTRMAGSALRGALMPVDIPKLLRPLARIAALLDGQGHRLPAWRDAPPTFMARAAPSGVAGSHHAPFGQSAVSEAVSHADTEIGS